MTSPYRLGLPGPIEDGEYEDLLAMFNALRRASRWLNLPIVSEDEPKRFRIGFNVGEYRWTIRAGACQRQLQRPELYPFREFFRVGRSGRIELAHRLHTIEPGVSPPPPV